MSGYFEQDGSGDLQPIASFAGTVDMWFELDGSGDIQPRAAAAEPNFPSEGSTRLGVVYGYSSEYTGRLSLPGTLYVKNLVGYGDNGTEFVGVLSGTDTAPTSPTIAVANGGTSNAVATITGADAATTNTVYSQPWSGGTWNDCGSVTANGTVAFGIASGAYWFKALSSAGAASNASNVVFQTITGTSDPLQYQILEAVRDQVNASGLTGGNGSALAASIAWPPEWGTWTAGQVFVMPDSESVDPQMTGLDNAVLGVNVVLCEASNATTDLPRQMSLRESIRKLFVGKRLSSLPDVWCQSLTESKVFSESALLDFQGIYPLTFAFQTRVKRT